MREINTPEVRQAIANALDTGDWPGSEHAGSVLAIIDRASAGLDPRTGGHLPIVTRRDPHSGDYALLVAPGDPDAPWLEVSGLDAWPAEDHVVRDWLPGEVVTYPSPAGSLHGVPWWPGHGGHKIRPAVSAAEAASFRAAAGALLAAAAWFERNDYDPSKATRPEHDGDTDDTNDRRPR